MDIRPIHTQIDHEQALADVERLMAQAPVPGTPEGDHLDILVTLIERYEETHHPIGFPDPIEAIRERMSNLSLSQRELSAATGIAESKLSEALNRRRGLSLSMVRALSRTLKLPADVLVQDYRLVVDAA